MNLIDAIKNARKNELFEEASYDNIGSVSNLETLVKTNGSFEVQDWLPFISSKYKISSSLQDYFVVSVIIMPTDLPNRKQVSFPLKSLVDFNPNRGLPNYKTWKGMPVQIDHQNQDIKKAIGVVLDTALRPMKEVPDFYKVVALLAIDKTKNPEIAEQIISGKRKYYSMGAVIDSYECSICGMRSKPGRIDTECNHVSRSVPRFFERKGGIPKSAHYLAHGINGFEVSTVTFPAWASAETELSDIIDMRV
jgi:hypothetical protein